VKFRAVLQFYVGVAFSYFLDYDFVQAFRSLLRADFNAFLKRYCIPVVSTFRRIVVYLLFAYF